MAWQENALSQPGVRLCQCGPDSAFGEWGHCIPAALEGWLVISAALGGMAIAPHAADCTFFMWVKPALLRSGGMMVCILLL